MMPAFNSISFRILAVWLLGCARTIGADPTGVSRLDFFGYSDCVALQNESTRVVLCHQAGGRVLEYALQGKNAIALDEAGRGSLPRDGQRVNATGGRIDVGPEQTLPKHPLLWEGSWTIETPRPFTAVMTSQKDAATGLQLRREFVLDPKTSRLDVTQTMTNVSDHLVECCHWSRTFGQGYGVAVVPISDPSRFPSKYVMYQPDGSILMKPVDPHITLRDRYLVIDGVPKFPKLGFDSTAGWFAYAMPNDLLWVKSYDVYPDRPYTDVAGLTLSIWYPDKPMVELEPIGPRERLEPGASASFTETWMLHTFDFPEEGRPIDVDAVARHIQIPNSTR
jgi:hypothetical protein